MSAYWYALRSQPHKEDPLVRQLSARGIETFYPCIHVQPVNPRSRKIRPYFPGYMFVHTDLADVGISTFQWMPYATGLVTFGGDPPAVPDNLITAITRRVGEINAAGGEIFLNLKKGETVQIDSGPFTGYEAIFDVRLPGSERVRVLLKMLSARQLPVEMDARQMHPKRKTL